MIPNIFNKDGKQVLYAPIAFDNIVKEQYVISKYTNTSFNEVGNMSYTERKRLLKLIQDEQEQIKKATGKHKK